MDYVVYSTSNSDYQSWQCKLLEYSFKKVQQPGKLIRLCSYNYHDPNRKFDTSDISEIIRLPDYRTRWTNYTKEVDKDYGIMNKTESLKYWLKHYPGLKDTDNILFIDPDMVFVKPVTERVTEGTIIGQRWVDTGAADGKPFRTYASHIKDRVKADTIFMYPYIATVGDLKKIVDRYTSLCYKMRLENHPDLWESEMYSLIISALEQNHIEVKTLDNLGYCTTWTYHEQSQDKSFVDSVSLLHYPWSILDKEGNRIFNKQDYTPHTKAQYWDRINPNNAANYIEQKFLQVLDSYNLEQITDFYWEDSELIDSLDEYVAKDKYLIFKPWPGGFNNIRMSLELAACLAFIQDRILVLPPEYRMYLLDNTNSMSTFFDTSDLGIKTISFEEFETTFNVKGWEQIEQISHVVSSDVIDTMLVTTIPPDDILHNRQVRNINDLNNHQLVYFKENLLGSFYLTLYTNKQPELCKYVARHIHYNKEIFTEAYKAVVSLGENYYAIHIRRNDFQYKDLFLSIEQIYNNIKNVVPEGAKLYISTDETDKTFFDLLKEHYELYFYDDIKHLIYSNINVDLIGPIEQIICTQATTFIGNKLSTFSSYIYRLRGYMKYIADKRFLTYNVECQPDKEEDYWWVATWAREYKQAFEYEVQYFHPELVYEPKTVFVSVASYRDAQITDTVDSLLGNQSGKNNIIVGVCLQDTEENYNNFKYKDHPNVRTHFIPYQEAKGVGHARRLLQQDIFQDEDYFLQIDSHSRACKNWDDILIKQIDRCPIDKAVLSTYPNGFDVLDEEQKYFKHNTCPYLKIHYIDDTNKLHATSAGIVPAGEVILGFWIAAGFLFTRGKWCREVEYSADFYFTGEEDHLSVLSYIKGWNVYVPDVSTIWHDYTDNRIQSPKKYRPLHWEDHPGVNANIPLITELYTNAYGIKGERTVEQFLDLAKSISNYETNVSIEVVFDYDKIPMHDISKEVLVIIFAFKDKDGKEIYRPDITDIDIIDRNKNTIDFHFHKNIHEQIDHCIWFIKYTDESFSECITLPITKQDNKYII